MSKSESEKKKKIVWRNKSIDPYGSFVDEKWRNVIQEPKTYGPLNRRFLSLRQFRFNRKKKPYCRPNESMELFPEQIRSPSDGVAFVVAYNAVRSAILRKPLSP